MPEKENNITEYKYEIHRLEEIIENIKKRKQIWGKFIITGRMSPS